MNSKRALKGVIWSLIDKLFNQLGYLAATLYLAKIIGPESFGLIGMLMIFMLLADSVISNGFSQALIQKSSAITRGDESTIFYVNLAWGVGIYSVLFILSPFIAGFYERPELTEIARLLFLVIIINSLTVVVRAKLIIKLDFKSQAVAGSFAVVVSSFLGIYLATEGFGYWSLVWMTIAKSIITSSGLWYFCRWWPSVEFSASSFRSFFKFGSNLMLAGMLATGINNLYLLLVGRYYSATQVGYFTQATNLSNFLSAFISSTLQGVSFPILTSIKEERDKLRNVYVYITSLTVLVSLPLLIGFASVSEEFVLIFLGDEWLPAASLLSLLCFARVVTPISAINMNILNAIGRSDLFLKVDLFKLPIIFISLLLAVPYGVEAIAWSIVITSLMSFFINAYYPGKLFGFGALQQLKVSRSYIGSALLMYLAVDQVEFENLVLDLTISIFVGGGVYFLSLLLLGDDLFKVVCSKLVGYIR